MGELCGDIAQLGYYFLTIPERGIAYTSKLRNVNLGPNSPAFLRQDIESRTSRIHTPVSQTDREPRPGLARLRRLLKRAAKLYGTGPQSQS
jgi:hypothetical protein